ncbi:MAG: hypothetical protein PHZ26_00360 [Candidatus Gracilibacteria bacterium]|nr:hypothetical protein [Candidatus Gracilibacteria bacterium]MDD2908189.1 hypothetical protein [Candidatus Gracilibacteria bacterium]
MQNIDNNSNGEINIFGKGDRGNGMTDSDSICRTDGALRTIIHLPQQDESTEYIRENKKIGLIKIASLKVTQLVAFMLGN